MIIWIDGFPLFDGIAPIYIYTSIFSVSPNDLTAKPDKLPLNHTFSAVEEL